MKYCKKCLQTDKRPNTVFDGNGVCPACIYHETLASVDWEERRKELDEIAEFGKKNNYSGYDCIIGVSGGKDSTRQAMFVREVLKMHPLLVCLSYPPEQLSHRGADNISNLIKLGFDCISIYPSPKIWKSLMKKSFMRYANWCRSTELSLFSSVPRFAIAYQIPLIWWGENAALQLGDLGVMGKSGGDGNNLRYMNTLNGGDISWLLSEYIKKNQVLQYSYPSAEEMINANLRIVFLGYYWRHWSLLDNADFSTLHGLDVRDEPPWDIGEPFGVTALDEDWVGMNQMIKYLKFGFGRTTDYVNEEIRKGEMSRRVGIDLVKKYDGKCSDNYIKSFCNYIEITVEEFWRILEQYVDQDLFTKNDKGRWIPTFEVGIDNE
jgi:N-acetyl sugar amidotransferase